MSAYMAWQEIIKQWGCKEWKAIPTEIQKVLNLDSRLGICHCCLVTQNGAKGMNQFIERMNQPRNV